MSDDLIDRARGLADCDSRAGAPLGKCLLEMADEIARLRAEALREAAGICDKAREVVIHNADERFLMGVRRGHDRCKLSILARAAELEGKTDE